MTTTTSELDLPVGRFVDNLVLRGKKATAEVSQAVLSADASISIDQVGEVTFTLHDPDFELLRSDLFNVGGRADFLTFKQEIAAVETGAAGDNRGMVTIRCRALVVQKLKRRTGTKVMRNASPSQFIAAECKAVGAKYVVQPTTKRKTVARDTKKAGDDAGRPSSWTTFQRFAQETGFVMFEANGVIYFGRPTWLAKQDVGEIVEVTYATGGGNDTIGVPRFSESADDDGVVTVSFDITRDQLEQYMPGQRIRVLFEPYDSQTFLVTSLAFPIAPEGLAAVTAAKPVDSKPGGTTRPSNTGGGGGGGGKGVGGGGKGGGGGKSRPSRPGKPSSPSPRAIDLGDLLHDAGFRGRALDIACGVAIAESGGFANGRYYVRARVLGDTGITTAKWGPSVGIFQIRSLRHPFQYTGEDRLRVQSKLVNPRFNARAAFQLSNGGKNWGAWSAYTSGRYRQYVGRTGALVKGAAVGGGGGGGKGGGGKGGGGGGGGGGGKTSPVGRRSAHDFVNICLRQAGDRYVYGAEVSLGNPNPNVFDCSELIQWAAHRVGCFMPDGSSNQIGYLRSKGRTVSVQRGLATRGAILWIPGHVAVSLGGGRGTIEATNSQYGVRTWRNARSFRWQAAGLVPGMRY